MNPSPITTEDAVASASPAAIRRAQLEEVGDNIRGFRGSMLTPDFDEALSGNIADADRVLGTVDPLRRPDADLRPADADLRPAPRSPGLI